MATLVKVYVCTDWKGRPNHDVEICATGTASTLLKVMEKLLREWQLGDLRNDYENDDGKMSKKKQKLFEALKKDVKRLVKVWTGKGDYRWEQEFVKGHDKKQRVLAGDNGEGETWSVSWTILETK